MLMTRKVMNGTHDNTTTHENWHNDRSPHTPTLPMHLLIQELLSTSFLLEYYWLFGTKNDIIINPNVQKTLWVGEKLWIIQKYYHLQAKKSLLRNNFFEENGHCHNYRRLFWIHITKPKVFQARSTPFRNIFPRKVLVFIFFISTNKYLTSRKYFTF